MLRADRYASTFSAIPLVVVLFLTTLSVPGPTSAANHLVHGLWVWKSPTVLAEPHAAESLLEFCKSQDINEVYVSISERSKDAEERNLVQLIKLLHRSNIRVEALLSSTEADEAGKHRDTLVRHVQEIVEFNRRHASERFDGIHLDIEPWQRPENKGSGNLRFLSGLADAYRAVCAVAEPARLTVNADIQNKLLKGDLGQRGMLLSAVPRVTLMMYELSSPTDGQSPEQKAEKVQQSSQKFLDMAYQGLGDRNMAKMAVALRTPDYLQLLPQMLKKLDEANRSNPHYLGWARHSYNDQSKAAQ
jgi:hypothetical protein